MAVVGAAWVAPAALAAYELPPKLCSPDGGQHTVAVRLHMSGANNDGVKDKLTAYDVRYARSGGWAYGTQHKNNEVWTQQDVFGDQTTFWTSPDSAPVGVWESRNIPDIAAISSLYVSLFFDRTGKTDPSCWMKWGDQS